MNDPSRPPASPLAGSTPATPQQVPIRIAVWSGPRNVSTALMRSFESRGDAAVCDEPLYAHYLEHTGLEHPGAEEITATGQTDWREVARTLTGPAPGGKRIFYQKHMAHHLLPHVGRDWLGALDHAFLLRNPREMLPSLDAVFPGPGLEDTGLPQQVELFDALRADGAAPPVIDSRDLLENPRAVLTALCARLGIPFLESMLEWRSGPRDSDGIWAKHWYASVERSTGFAPYRPKEDPLPAHLAPLLEECRAPYERLYAHRITA